MDEDESERQRKLKAGREKLLQFQQKKRGGKKKKKASSKSVKNEPVEEGKKQDNAEHGASSPPSEQDVSIASADTDKDISSIASEAECQVIVSEQEPQLNIQSGEESNTGSYASGSYTSGEESYTSEDGGVDDLVIANLERNELKNRTFELEEQLVAKKTALKDISKENAELKAKLDDIERASSQEGHATVVLELSGKINNLEKDVNEKQSAVHELQNENGYLRKRMEEYQELDRSESSQVEELKGKLKTKQVTLSELNKQNEDLSKEVYNLKMKLSNSQESDSAVLMENLKVKENAVQQLSVENANQRVLIKSLEDGLNQSKAQLYEYHNVLQIKDQELNQLVNVKEYAEALQQNMAKFNQQLNQKNQEIQQICYERDEKLWQASQEITRLQQEVISKENESQNNANNTQTTEEYESKISGIMGQLAERNSALENTENQLAQLISQQKRGEEELLLLKSYVQEQTEKLLSSQEELNSFSLASKEKEKNISILQQQLGSLSQVNEEMSRKSEKVGQQMLDLQNLLHDRNQKISHLEISVSEISEERELMKNEMTKQSQELLEQIKDLHAQLSESNTRVKEQSEDMDNSFSELQFTQDMMKDLQKEMLEKDLSLDNLSQKLRNSETNHKEVLEGLQKKSVEEKEKWQKELAEKDKIVNEIEQQLNYEKSVTVDLRTTIENLNAEVETRRSEAVGHRNDLFVKEQAFNDLERVFNHTKQQQNEEIESLKLELEKVQEEASPDVEISEKYQEEVKQLQVDVLEKESFVEELSKEVQERDQKIVSLELEVSEKLQQLYVLQEELDNTKQEHEETVLNIKATVGQQQELAKNVENSLVMDFSQAQSQHQNEIASLKAKYAEEISRLRKELDEKYEELDCSSQAESRLEEEMLKVREQNKKEIESFHVINKELENKLHEAEQQLLNDTPENEGNILNLKEQLEHQKEENEKVIKLIEALAQEKDELIARNTEMESELEAHLSNKIERDNEMKLLNENIKALENELRESQTKEEQLLKEKKEYGELLQNSDDANKQEVLSLSGKLQRQEEEHGSQVKQLQDTLRELQESQEEFVREKKQLVKLLQKSEEKLREKEEEQKGDVDLLRDTLRELQESNDVFVKEKEQLVKLLQKSEARLQEKQNEHDQEIRQMDDQLEQTRQMIESIRRDNDNKVANLQESLGLATEDFQKKLQLKEDKQSELVANMEKKYEELGFENEKSRRVNTKEQPEQVVQEKEQAMEEDDLEDFDWTSNSFEQPFVEENIVASENWMDSQTIGDGPSLFTVEKTSWGQPEEQQRVSDVSKKENISPLSSGNDLDSLQQITFLQEKLAEKEKSELELIEEKNKLLKIVKEYNKSLASERDSLKEKMIDQDQTIKDLQDQLSTSELVSSDIQQVFGRQLLVLQEQRDSLLGRLEEQKKDQSSFVDILEEKHALEENLRSEKEQLAEKLRQKELLETQLEHERAALQEQLIRQARLNEIIREKDVLEEELTEQKNRLQLELSTIENSLFEKEQLLQRETETLQAELLGKDLELHSWQGQFKTKEEQLIQERERLEKTYTNTLLSTRTELEDTYQQTLQHLRTELEVGYRQRLFEVQEDFQSHHEEEMANLGGQHEQQIGMWYELAMWLLQSVTERECFKASGIKAEYEEKIQNLKGMLEEQRRKQVSTMKNVLERDREKEVEHLMDNHDNDMEELRKELNLRHQDIVSAIVERLKQSHQQEMENCLASAITDTVLKVEVARLELEREYDSKFDELRKKAKLEIDNLKTIHEEETKEWEAKYQGQLEKTEQLERRNVDLSEELTEKYEKSSTSKLDELRKKLNQDHKENIEQMREEIEMEYEDQMETLQDELEGKYETSLRELREELEKRSREITASAVEELQQKHFSEMDMLKSEHEHVYEQMNTVREKVETSYKEDIQDLEEKLEQGKEKVKEMESRIERMDDESRDVESERINTLTNRMEGRIAFLEQEHQEKIIDIQKEMEKQLKQRDETLNKESQNILDDFEKEKIAMELKHLSELREMSIAADKRISEKEEQHVTEINQLQQKLVQLREDGEEATFREVDESRQQLSEKYQKDLDAIVRELKLRHQKQIHSLISEAESNQINNERDEFEKWKISVMEKHEKETRELRSEHQRELEVIRKHLEEERLDEVTKVSNALSVKNTKELEGLREQLATEYEEEVDKIKVEYQSYHDNEIARLSTENQMVKLQHDGALNDLQENIKVLAQEIEPLKKEVRIYKDLVQEKELEIENLKSDHQKYIKELKQRNFDNLLEEVCQVRADLALDAAREVELVKMESDYELAKKVNELQDEHKKEIAAQGAKIESIEKENESLKELLRVHAQETLELKKLLENEKNELNRVHNEAIQNLKTKLDVEQQNSFNELKVRLMKDMDEMQAVLKSTSEDEYKKMEADFTARELQIKDKESREREEILNNLKQENEREVVQLRERLNRDRESALDELKQGYENRIQDAEEKFAQELKAERERLEKEKEKDLATLEEALSGSIVEKQELQLKLLNEQHSREVESLKEDLVKTHMEKFTLMTEHLEQAHQEEIEQVRQSVEQSTRQEFQTKVKEAEELARYNLEKEQLENLKQLEQNLQKKHEGQLNALSDLLEHHQGQLKKLKDVHEVEKQELNSEWEKKLSDELIAAKSEHNQEMTLINELLDKAETEVKHNVLEMETKDKNLNEMANFMDTASAEYEERLAKIRKEFDYKLEEMRSNSDSSYKVEMDGIRELLSKQHTEELERHKEEHEKHIELLNNELEGANALKMQIQEESEQKTAEQEQAFNSRVSEFEEGLSAKEMRNEELKEKNENLEKELEEKEKDCNKLQEEKQAADINVRTLESHVREMLNRQERERDEDGNLIRMLRADLDAVSSERNGLQLAKDKLLRLLSATVRTTLVTEETITSRLETLLEQSMNEDGADRDTVSEVNSISETEDSIREGFRRPLLASSTPAVLPAAARAREDNVEDDDRSDEERTLTDDEMKQVEESFGSDEGLELSAMLNDSIIQGSVDFQNEETVIDSGNRLRIAVKNLLDLVASLRNQLNDAQGTEDELLNTTAQKTEQLNQLTQAQQVLMLRLQDEIESREDLTNRLRNAEEDMEVHIAEIDQLGKRLKEKDVENNEKPSSEETLVKKQQQIEALEKEKEHLLQNVETSKSKTEDIEKSYEKEKQDLCEKIAELQHLLSQTEGKLKTKTALEEELHKSEASLRQVAQERDELLKKITNSEVAEEKPVLADNDDLPAVVESLKLECLNKETEIVQLREVQDQLRNDVSNLEQSKDELVDKLRSNGEELLKQTQEHELEIERLEAAIAEAQDAEELREALLSQQNILDEQRDLLTQAENDKISNEEEISNLKDALIEAETKVEEGEEKMQEVLTNIKNFEETYKAQTSQVTQQLNKKVEELQKELDETEIKLDQHKKQGDIITAQHTADLMQHHSEEIQSLRTHFETEIQDTIERTKADFQEPSNEYTMETDQEYVTEPQEVAFDPDSNIEARLNIEIMNVDGFTRTIAGYFSELAPLTQDSFNENGVSDHSTSEKIETIMDDVKMEADAIYNLVNSLPAFYDPNFKSLQMAWREEKEILIQAIKRIKEIAVQRPEETSDEKDWRATILIAVLDFLNKEEEMLSSELQAMELLVRDAGDAVATSKLIKRRQQKQDELHRQSVNRLYQTDRISLMNEIKELQNTLASVKEELSLENNKLEQQLQYIQEQVKKREQELLQQVRSKETLLQQERKVISELRAEREVDKNRLHEANALITRERNFVKDLQDHLNRSRARLKVSETAIEKERTQTAVIQTCLDSERAKCSNLEQQLKLERLNVESREREVEQKNQLLQDMTAKELDNVGELQTAVLQGKQKLSEVQTQLQEERTRNAKLKTEIVNKDNVEEVQTVVLQGKQKLSEVQTQLQEERTRNAKLKAEIVDKENISNSDNEKLGNVIKNLKGNLQNEKSHNRELLKSLNEERKISEELNSKLTSVNGVKEQISDQEQLITELSQALDNERRVNEELRNALDNEYESFDKIDYPQLNAVKELQTSLTAVQEQLQSQIEVVDQERTRVQRLRKERDIHEATAMGAHNKERKLEKELDREKVAREIEIQKLKDAMEREVAEKTQLEETMSERNTEFEVLCNELQSLKNEKKSRLYQTPPTSPSRDRINILRHDLKSLIDEHRVLLIMHKDYLGQQLKKTPDSTKATSNLREHIESLLSEIDGIKMQLSTFSEGLPIPLSPVKAAAYDRVAKQNKELSDYVAKLTEEKAELRSALRNLELQISEYRQREGIHEENSRRTKHEMEALLTNERSRSAQDRLLVHQTTESQKKRLNELEMKLREKENEIEETKRTLHVAENDLERIRGTVKRLQSTEMQLARWTPARIQKLYGRYMRAEKSRKSLTYQKRYLVLLLGGFRNSETRTLSLIAKMGAYPSFQQPSSRFSAPFTKFRTAVRVVIATKRMGFLVRKSKNSIQQVIEPNDATARSSPSKNHTADMKRSRDGSKSKDPYKPRYPQVSLYQNVSARSPLELKEINDNRYDQHDINSESKDTSSAEVYPPNTSTTIDRGRRADTGIYSRYDDRMNEETTSATANHLPVYQTTSPNRYGISSAQRDFHSPPIRERVPRYEPSQSGIRSTSFQSYPFHRETNSQHDVHPNYDAQDLDRKIQTLDNLQQKLSVTRGSNHDRTRHF